jgi:hypothetical protein
VKIKIKNKLEGKNKFFIRRLNWNEKNSKTIKKIRTKLNTIRHKFRLKDEIKNHQNFYKETKEKIYKLKE